MSSIASIRAISLGQMPFLYQLLVFITVFFILSMTLMKLSLAENVRQLYWLLAAVLGQPCAMQG